MISDGPSVTHLADFVNGSPFKPQDLGDEGWPVVRIRQLLDPSAPIDYSKPPERPVWIEDGDLVFAWSGTIAAQRWRRGRALLNQHLFRVDPRPGVDRDWLAYVLEEGARRLKPFMHGSAMTHITRPMLKSLRTGVPSGDGQRRIVEYLDTETARIDGLIFEQKHLIAVLHERRRASVFDAVTGRSVAGQRRGGVPWVADIPAHWTAARLTSVARLGSGHTPARNRPALWQECTIPWVTTGEVWQVRSDVQEVLTETRECISEAGVRESAAVVHPAGTVVLCRTAASAGYSALMGSDMATSQDFATWTCGSSLRPRFLLHCLRAMRPDLLGRLAMGSTHRTIYMPEIRSLVVPLPPVDEQDAILKDLDRTLSQLDTVRAELELQMSLLDEHRQALITAAVTGGLEAVGRVA